MSEELFIPRSLEELEFTFPPELQHISASSLKMAVRCEEQWRQRYILGKKSPPALAAIAGRADHQAIAASMTQKIETFTDLPIGEVRDLYVATLETEVEKEGGLNELEIKGAESLQDKVKAFDDERQHGPDVVATYQREISPLVQPLAVEREFRLTTPDVPVEVLGYIDLIAVDSSLRTASKRIIDRKRRSRKTLKIEPEWSIQAEIYQLAEPLPHEWHLSVTTKVPQAVAFAPELIQPLPPRSRSELLLKQLVAKLGWLYRRFGPDEPWPSTGRLHPWACSYCGYRDDCWAWRMS